MNQQLKSQPIAEKNQSSNYSVEQLLGLIKSNEIAAPDAIELVQKQAEVLAEGWE